MRYNNCAAKLRARDTERDRRDRVLLGLLAGHGLRVGEIAALTWTNVDMAARDRLSAENRRYNPAATDARGRNTMP